MPSQQTGFADLSSGGGGSVAVQEDDSVVVASTSVLNFEGAVTVSDEGSGKATVTIGSAATVIGNVTTTTYDTVEADFNGNTIKTLNNASGVTVTVTADVSYVAPCTFVQTGSGAITFEADTGVTLYSYNSLVETAGQYAAATLIPIASNTYILIGQLA